MASWRDFAVKAAIGVAGAIMLTIIAVCMVAIVKGGMFAAEYLCEAAWPDSETRWTLSAFCQVKVEGQWVPSQHVRKILPE